MSDFTRRSIRTERSAANDTVIGFNVLTRAVLALAGTWLRRTQTRKRLRHLEAHELVDIGYTESERRRESAKWFWQD